MSFLVRKTTRSSDQANTGAQRAPNQSRHPRRGRGEAFTRPTRLVAAATALLLPVALGLPAVMATTAVAAPVGQGFNLNASDLRFILKQIKISEQHAATATAANPCGTLTGTGPDQLPVGPQSSTLPLGLRTVDGSCNNLVDSPDQTTFGTANKAFPRMTAPNFKPADNVPEGFGPPGSTSYLQKKGSVFDSQPRLASNLIVDQTATNPAALAAAPVGSVAPPAGEDIFIPNVAPDVGLSAPYNSWFTLFGQFFDHGLDLTNKGGSGTVFMPLQADDPLFNPAPGSPNFMVLTRSTNQPGLDGVVGDNPATLADESADDVKDATNQTSSFVDQSQTYSSHPSHQVFLRQYALNAVGDPVSTGKLITGAGGGMADWTTIKTQTRNMLGINLVDADVLSVPLLATDAYGKFTRGPTGFPQMVTIGGGLVEGNPAANAGTGVSVPANAIKSGQAFLDDIAHHAVPGTWNHDNNPATAKVPQTPDTNPGTADDVLPGTYDDEMLNAHFIAGDGRLNENIGLTAVHSVFHSEHNRLTADIQNVIATEDASQLTEWQSSPGVWNGERLFQASRFVTEMEYQHLAFEEFARKVQPQVNLFAGYDSSIDPAIVAEFAHAVYRFGHSMLTEKVARTNPAGVSSDIPLLDAFLNPPAFLAGGLTPEQATGNIVRGMTDQVGNELDEFVTGALRSRLLGLPLDLAALNMARARETGVPSLNAARRQFFAATNGSAALAPYANWNDFKLAIKHPDSLVNFVAAYGTHPSITGTSAARRTAAARLLAADPLDTATPADSVAFMEGTGAWANVGGVTTTGLDTVDLWLGGLAEKVQPFGGMLGSTFNFVFEKQMENLQDGDRLYYLSRTAGLNMLVQLEGNSFAELIQRNTDVEGLPADSFSRPDYKFNLAKLGTTGPILDDLDTPYNEADKTVAPGIDLSRMTDGTVRYAGPAHVVFNGSVNNDRAQASEGDDTLRGNNLDDRLEGGAGNDTIIGGLGDDIMTDTFGDDVMKGGDGNDAINSGQGFDLNQPGRGNDFVVGGSDPTETFGGAGNDFIIGGDSFDTVFGDDGDDWIEGGGQADLLQGDNGAPFQDDPNAPGHDVIKGDGGNDDYDSEGGDDIMVAGPGIERNEGMLGFDWTTHKSDPSPANADMNFTGLLPPSLDALRDRFDLVEGLSGWTFNDVLRGDSGDATTMAGHELNAAGIARITGLAGELPTGAAGFTGGNIILGGGGNDVIEGRGGDDIINGDKYLNVRLSVRDAAGVEIQSAENMSQLQAAVFAGTIKPGQISIVREVLTGSAGTDTAVFSDVQANYDCIVGAAAAVPCSTTSTGATTQVVHARGTATDGTDTIRNIESLTFSDTAAPSAPIIGVAVAGIASATVNWTAPDTGIADSFSVKVLQAGVQLGALLTAPAGATSLVVNGLTNGTTYTFQVSATNTLGTSLFSAASNAVTPRADFVAPTVTARTPAPGARSVSQTGNLTATFSEPVTGVSATQFVLRFGTTVIPAAVSYDATTRVATLNPTETLIADRTYTAAVSGVLDTAGNTMVPISWSFLTGPAPTLVRTTPGGAATAVPQNTNVTATFSEALTGVSATSVRLTRVSDGAVVAGSLALLSGSTIISLDPTASLLADTQYRMTITGGNTSVRDLAGNPITTVTWTFFTGPAPTLVRTTPGGAATAVPRNTNVTATFSEAVTGVSATSVRLTRVSDGAVVAGSLALLSGSTIISLDPTASLLANTQYRMSITGGPTSVRDLAGNPITTLTWVFTTGTVL